MTELCFKVRGWAAWTPQAGPLAGGDTEARPVPALLRRRVSPLGQRALAAAHGLAGCDLARYVFSSRHGEYGRTHSLLSALCAGEALSPADFSLAVHHALAGLLSIATGNKGGHTAVAAGPESFCFGLLEAAACLAEDPAKPVLLVHFDENLPPDYDGLIAPESPLALAVMLAGPGGEGQSIQFRWSPAAADGRHSGAGLALDFLRFLQSDAASLENHGPRMTWRWCRVG